jgi:hypothetical protein
MLTPLPSGVFFVDASQDLGEISRYVLGVNHGVPFELSANNLEPAQNGGFTFLRWPGGIWGDNNDVTAFNIDTYIERARMMGAEPSIGVRLPHNTPEKAAEEVRYVNLEKKYGVTYWAIGNEPSLYPIDQEVSKLGFDAVTVAEEWRRFALAMKAVDPTIKLIGPDTHGFTGNPALDPKYDQGRLFLNEFLKINGDLIDIVVVHWYPFPACKSCGSPTVDELLADTPKWDDIIPNLRRVVQETTGREIPVGITEYNSNYSNYAGGTTSPDSFFGALWLSDVMGRMIRHQPEILAYWILKTGGNSGHGLLESNGIRPGYYVFQMYKRFGNRLLAAESPDPMVSLFAAKTDAGKLSLIFVNRSEVPVRNVLQIERGDTLRIDQSYLFDRDHLTEEVAPPAWKNGDPIELGPYSMTLFLLTP